MANSASKFFTTTLKNFWNKLEKSILKSKLINSATVQIVSIVSYLNLSFIAFIKIYNFEKCTFILMSSFCMLCVCCDNGVLSILHEILLF